MARKFSILKINVSSDCFLRRANRVSRCVQAATKDFNCNSTKQQNSESREEVAALGAGGLGVWGWEGVVVVGGGGGGESSRKTARFSDVIELFIKSAAMLNYRGGKNRPAVDTVKRTDQ